VRGTVLRRRDEPRSHEPPRPLEDRSVREEDARQADAVQRRDGSENAHEWVVTDVDPPERDAVPREKLPCLSRSRCRGPAEQVDRPARWLQIALARGTSKLSIIPLSWCSTIWQWAIHRPGFLTSIRDADGLAGAYEDGVLPDEVGFQDAVAGEDDETAGSVDVEGMVDRVVRVHLIDKAKLDAVAALIR
jgi:hypothetical protein